MIASANALLAISWQPGLRGITVVLIAFTVLCGSTYLILGTNLGARLGMLVALAGLFGWMMLMGAIWIVYGIGLKGKEPSWKASDTIVGKEKLVESKVPVARDATIPDNTIPGTRVNGWLLLPEDNGGRGQAIAAADEILQVESKALKAGDYIPVAVYDKGGERWPNYHSSTHFTVKLPWQKHKSKVDFGSFNFDYFAFFHNDHFAMVEVAPVIKVKTEPGKAPPKVEADPAQPHWFVLMQRDRGSKRLPATFITIGSALLFAIFCRMLHRRDLLVDENRDESRAVVKVDAETRETVSV
jgi:hypothetical protein